VEQALFSNISSFSAEENYSWSMQHCKPGSESSSKKNEKESDPLNFVSCKKNVICAIFRNKMNE